MCVHQLCLTDISIILTWQPLILWYKDDYCRILGVRPQIRQSRLKDCVSWLYLKNQNNKIQLKCVFNIVSPLRSSVRSRSVGRGRGAAVKQTTCYKATKTKLVKITERGWKCGNVEYIARNTGELWPREETRRVQWKTRVS